MMMRIFSFSELSVDEFQNLLLRPKMSSSEAEAAVRPIIDDVKSRGDEAVLHYNRKFGGIEQEKLFFSLDELPAHELTSEVKKAIDVAIDNISRFHSAQIRERLTVETMPGVRCFREFRPIDRVGLYVPGGTAPLPSTAMMLAIPAKIAGCREIYMATPLRDDGSFLPEIIYIAKKCGISGILSAGGAQAVAAMGYGTQSIPKVDKLFGPGNQYVTAAKTILANSDAHLAIDMPAGPSEVLVLADSTSNPAFVAADLLSQAEHGSDSQVVLVITEDTSVSHILAALQTQLDVLPRKTLAEQALRNGFILRVKNIDEGLTFSNRYAPEHLIIQTENAHSFVNKIANAGSVFLGHWSPESVGDYASGTNHTLPTFGYARQYGGVSTESFGKYVTFQELNKNGLRNLGPFVETLATVEGLEAHKNAVSIRLKNLDF